MPNVSPAATLLTVSSPEDRLDFMLRHFSSKSLHQALFSPLSETSDLGSHWLKSLDQLLELICETFVARRTDDKCSITHFSELLDIEILRKEAALSWPNGDHLFGPYLLSLPGVVSVEEPLSGSALQIHANLAVIVQQGISSLLKTLAGEAAQGQRQSGRRGEVLLEGDGFEVYVGPKYQPIIRYPEGKTAVILMHDPRDGHFLLIERFSEIDSLHVLEFPKVPASKMMNRESAASITLQELTGLPLRKLEKIGEIRPDVHMISGSCEVYYGTFDLEENIIPNKKWVRDVKRITEEGLYESGFEGRVTCALTLSAISIWRAFESVRKKREANSRRVRGPRSTGDSE